MIGITILTKNGKTVRMKLPLSFLALSAIFAVPAAASAETSAETSIGFDKRSNERSASFSSSELPPYLQCVPFAREVSGIQIYGDAHSWWDQAEGRYQRGNRPQVGAVMAFQPHQNMTLGHVAAVSKVIDRRTVLISHANWSPINGRRGQIERDVRAVDISPDNDWSMVRVWYDPLQAIGTTAWPVHGFIYGEKAMGRAKPVQAENRIAQLALPTPVAPTQAPTKPSKQFTQAFADMGAPIKSAPKRAATAPQTVRMAQAAPRPTPPRPDPVRAAIARYEK